MAVASRYGGADLQDVMMNMNRSVGAAAKLAEGQRKALAVLALAGSESITELADVLGVSRKFV